MLTVVGGYLAPQLHHQDCRRIHIDNWRIHIVQQDMGVDKGFDFYPPLTDSDVDKVSTALPDNVVKEYLFQTTSLKYRPSGRPFLMKSEKYKTDDNMAIERDAIVFKQGEHPCLELDGHRFRRFSAKISGSHQGDVETYLDEIKIIAKRHFGWRVHLWHEMDHLSMDNMVYG